MVKMTTANIMHSKRCSASKSEHICGNLKKSKRNTPVSHQTVSKRDQGIYLAQSGLVLQLDLSFKQG